MRITAQFNGRCFNCGKPTPKGSEIEYLNKKAYCLACVPEETSGVSDEEQLRIADKCGFRQFSWESLRNVYVGDPDESSRDSGKASDTAEVGMREGEGIE
jgi:hypothetical protein